MSEDIERMITEVIETEQNPDEPVAQAATGTPVINMAQPMFEDDEILGLCAEALTNMRGDRKQLDTLIANLVEMVFNEGDPTTASKEALVGLITAKTNMSDKMMKIVDVMTKFKLKEIDNSSKTTHESYHGTGTRRSFLEQIERRMKKAKEKKNA